MATPPFENYFSGILSGRARGACLPNLKFVSLAVLEILAFKVIGLYIVTAQSLCGSEVT